MAIRVTTIAHQIASLTPNVTYKGASKALKVLDLHDLKVNILERDCPILFPQPKGFMSDPKVEYETFGLATAPKKTIDYNLTWTYCHTQIVQGRSILDVYADLVDSVCKIIDVLVEQDTNMGYDVKFGGLSDLGPVGDPNGNFFHGCTFTMHVSEYIDA
jgi:hypothetical protein